MGLAGPHLNQKYRVVLLLIAASGSAKHSCGYSHGRSDSYSNTATATATVIATATVAITFTMAAPVIMGIRMYIHRYNRSSWSSGSWSLGVERACRGFMKEKSLKASELVALASRAGMSPGG